MFALPSSSSYPGSPYAQGAALAPVGQESAEGRARALPPVEQAASQSGSGDAPRRRADEDASASQRAKADSAESRAAALKTREQRALQLEVDRLASRDREVRAHERAHAAVGGQYAGAPSYQYQHGPDGRRYAIAGEVSIDTGPVPGDPQATLAKAEQVLRAALAAAEPSAQDRAVAAGAVQMMVAARAELAAQPSAGEGSSAPAEAESRVAESSAAAGATEAASQRDDSARKEEAARQERQERAELERQARLEEARQQAAEFARRLLAIGALSQQRQGQWIDASA